MGYRVFFGMVSSIRLWFLSRLAVTNLIPEEIAVHTNHFKDLCNRCQGNTLFYVKSSQRKKKENNHVNTLEKYELILTFAWICKTAKFLFYSLNEVNLDSYCLDEFVSM